MHIIPKPSTRVAVRIRKPRLFIFLICRLIQEDLGRDFVFRDLLLFLGTTSTELKQFYQSGLPFYFWLGRLTETKGGQVILEYFNVKYSRELGYLEVETPEIIGSDDILENVFKEVDGTMKDSKAEKVNRLQKSLDRLASVAIQHDNRGGKMMEKLIIPKDKRDRFLVGLQGTLELKERFLFERTVGLENLSSFNQNGIVPAKWIELLQGKEGVDFLDRFKDFADKKEAAKVADPESSAETHPLFQKIKGARKKKGLAIPKSCNAAVLDNIKKLTGLKTDASIADIFSKHFSIVSSMRRGKAYLYADDIEILSDKLDISIDDILDIDVPVETDQYGIDESVDKSVSTVAIKTSDKQDAQENAKEDYPKRLPLEIEQIIQRELLLVGAVDPSLRKDVFFGRLIRKIPMSSMQYLQDDDRLLFKLNSGEFEYNLSHLFFEC